MTLPQPPSSADPPLASPAPPLIVYERRTLGIHPTPDGLHIEIGPMPASAFVVMLLPRVLSMLVGVIFIAIAAYTSWNLALILAALLTVLAIYSTVRVSRHRGARRQIIVHAGELAYTSPLTAGMQLGVIHTIGRIEVRRCPEMPWVWKLVVLPPRIKFFTSSLPTAGVSTTLLIDSDRALLQQIAAELKNASGLMEASHE